MSALLQAPGAGAAEPAGEVSDHALVARVRRGDDRAFEALYQRYLRRIHAYVYGMVKDHQRAEDVTQEVFVSALRRMRATERPIAFKPWIYEIAKNACIDQFRRSKRAEEVSFDADEGLAPSDYGRLVSREPVPDVAVAAKQQLDHMVGAFGGLSDAHHEILVLRELEGLSYREIGERMGMSRPAVESTLFRARRRLSEEYDELASGQRCLRVQGIIANAAGGRLGARDTRRLARHVAHCQPCRRQALAAGVDSALVARRPLRERAIEKVAGLLPFPLLGRRRGSGDGWTSQLPLVPDHAAAGGAKLAAAAAIVVAGLGAGVGTQVARTDDRVDRSARAVERVASQAASSAPLSAAVAASRSARDRSAPAAAGGDAEGERRVGTADGRRAGSGLRPKSGAPGGRSSSPTLPSKVKDVAPEAPAAPSAPDAPSAPSAPSAPTAGTPKPKIDLPKVQLPTVTVPDSTSGTTAPSLPTVDVTPTVDSVTQTVPSAPQTVEDVKETVTQPVEDATGLQLP